LVRALLFCCCLAAGAAVAVTADDPSPFELIFNQQHAALNAQDAPTILEGMGITCTYSVAELPTRDDGNWKIVGTSVTERSPTEQLRMLPTSENAAELLALTGLDMREILRCRELQAAGDRAGLIALLAKYIEPRMDKYNRKSVEGYDPTLCLNASGDRVYRLDITEGKLDEIRASVKLFHAGRYTEYRARLEKYLKEYPNLSYLHASIGNAYFAEGDLAGAEQWYRQGASANALNPMLGYSMAFCRLAEGDEAGAIEALTGAVIACRNSLLAWLALDCLLPGQGGSTYDHRFRNRTYVGVNSAHITVDKVPSQNVLDPWLYYGMAELVTQHARSGAWQGFDTWDLEALEYYKISHLLGMYYVQKSRAPESYDQDLEYLQNVFEAGYLPQYVLFEKIAPYTQYYRVAAQSSAGQLRMREYVERYVIRWKRVGGG
jgi:tetratricopeptide (TPR) repeat protein